MDAGLERAFEIRSVAVIGAGSAGRAFAFRCAARGLRVALEDVMPSNLRRAQTEFAEFAEFVESAESTQLSDSSGAAGSLRYAGTVEDAVHDADLALDFVPDELESKLEIFSLLDRMAPPRTILCTPTLTLSLTDLASCTYRPERCVALRAAATQLLEGELEIVRSRLLDPSIASAVIKFLERLSIRSKLVDDTEEPMLMKNLRPPTSQIEPDGP